MKIKINVLLLKYIKAFINQLKNYSNNFLTFFRKYKRLFISFFHAILMIGMMLFWIRQPFIFDYEFEICKDLIDLEYVIRLGNTQGENEYQNKFLYLNTSNNKELEIENQETSKSRTSRKELQKTLNILANNSTKFKVVLLDIFLDKPDNQNDSIRVKDSVGIINFQKTIDRLEGKIVITNEVINAEYTTINQSPLKTKKENIGIATYNKSLSDAFYRFDFSKKIDEDNQYHKQTPLITYELLEKKNATKPFFFGLFYKYNDKNDHHIYQNIIVPKMTLLDGNKISNRSLMNSQNDSLYFGIPFLNKKSHKDVNYYDIGEFNDLYYETAFDKLKNPIIIIGDFDSDIHYTTNGQVSGPLVLANCIISLYNKSNKLSVWYILFVITSFTFISYLTFFYLPFERQDKFKSNMNWLNSIINFLINEVNFIILILVTLIGIFVFKYYMFLFFNTIYLMIISKIINWNIKRKLKKQKIT